MPAKPAWHSRLPEISATLDALQSPTLDRAMVEELFALSPRQALRLMATVASADSYRRGSPAWIERNALATLLQKLLERRPVQGEIKRRRQLQASLAALERDHKPRLTPITPAGRDASLSWPEGICFSPGRIEIVFETGQQLLGRLLALAEQAASDIDGFLRQMDQMEES